MSDYAAVDAVLMPWAKRHDLHVYARDRDKPLRSIIAYYWRGTRHESAGHIWLDGPDSSGLLTVHGAAPGWQLEKSAPVEDLESALEAVFQTMVARPVWD
jgi:hypothetical protein